MKFDRIKSDLISQSLLGLKFRVGGRGDDGTVDCYGVLLYYFKEFGIKLPDYSYVDDWCGQTELYLQEYAGFFTKLAENEGPEVGDMLLFISKEFPSHAGIYIGESKFIHAYDGAGTRIDSLTNQSWKNKFFGCFRVKDQDAH